MKTIYLKVEVEDSCSTKRAVICLNDYDWREIHLPTEEEIFEASELIYPMTKEPSFFNQVNVRRMAFKSGANFVINKIKEQ